MFKTINPEDPGYAETKSFMTENAGAFDYNGLVNHLNEQKVGAIVSFPFRQGKLGQVRNGLSQRGLKNNVDFTVAGGRESDAEDAGFLAVVEKLSDAKGQAVVPKPRGKAAAAAAGTTAAASTGKVPPKRK